MTDPSVSSVTKVATQSTLKLDAMSFAYGDNLVLDRITAEVQAGEFLCIVGPSGTGKTTLLQNLAGLRTPTSGSISFEGKTVTGPPDNLAVVFQDYSRSLMPWLSAVDNVALPLKSAGVSKKERRERALQALVEVGLEMSGDKYPWQLSGGMQQRVAIARALAYEPSAILMDEPFASVDAQTRADLEDLTLRVRDRLGVTMILVTHDIDEAVYLSDRVLVLSGRPATVAEIIDVPLGSGRDQIETKAHAEFAELRSRVYRLIKNQAV